MTNQQLPGTAKKNVETIAALERQLLEQRSIEELIGDRVSTFFGSRWFIAAQALLIAAWFLINSKFVPAIEPFDPYPFPLLGTLVGIEFIFLTTCVLINQRLQSGRQERWAHLNLQLCMLAEQETTKNMQMLHSICDHLGLDHPGREQEGQELVQTTPVTALVDEIQKAAS